MNNRSRHNHARVLLVEDNIDQSLNIQMLIQRFMPNVTLIRTASASETLTYLRECVTNFLELPNLILLDLYLPSRKDGLQIIQALKATESAYKQIPIVVLSHSDYQEDILAMYQAGCASYLVKPVIDSQFEELFKLLRLYWLETAALPHRSP